jgi:lysozyme family protein
MNNIQKGAVAAIVTVGVTGIGAVATSSSPTEGIIAMAVVAGLGMLAWTVDRLFGRDCGCDACNSTN